MSSSTLNQLPPQVRQSIKRLIDAKRTGGLVSVSEIASEFHRICPDVVLSEEDLRRAVAIEAVDAGCPIYFDRP